MWKWFNLQTWNFLCRHTNSWQWPLLYPLLNFVKTKHFTSNKLWTDPQLSIMTIYNNTVNFNPLDYDYIVRWQSDQENTKKRSLHKIKENLLHPDHRFHVLVSRNFVLFAIVKIKRGYVWSIYHNYKKKIMVSKKGKKRRQK